MRYMGGKSRIAKQIASHLISHGASSYVEPFVGGGAVLTIVSRRFERVTAADVMADLIDMYKAIQGGWTPPDIVSEADYQSLRHADSSPLRTFVGFGASFGGKWWGGYARDSRGDNYARQTKNSLIKSAKSGMFDSHVSFESSDIFHLPLSDDLSDSVIYCDPPYRGTTPYQGVEPFDTDKAWELYRSWADQGAHVYVSEYDGPADLLVDEFFPQASLKSASSGRTCEKLFYIPPK